jgi:hypothetical protein
MNDRLVERLLQELAGHAGPLKGPPTRRVVTATTDPAAGAEVAAADFVVAASKIWVVKSFTVSLVQGATQTPLPALAWDDGTTILGSIPGATAALSVSTTARFTWTIGWRQAATAGAALTANTAPLPDPLILPAAYRLSTVTAGIGANSNYALASAVVDEYSV